MRLLVVIGIGVSLLGLVRRADATVCRTKAGAVVMRDACRSREVPIDLSVVGPTGPQGGAGPDGPAGPWTMRVVDAEAHEIGPAVEVSWYIPLAGSSLPGTTLLHVLVRDESIGGAALLGVDYVGQPTGTVYYASNDCSGQPVVFGTTFMPVLAVIGQTVFLPGPPAASGNFGSTESVRTEGGCSAVTPRGGCCRASGGSLSGLAVATTVPFGGLGITPPLRAVGP
jgi:hypothetical protein